MPKMKGKTQDAECPILPAGFWQKSTKLEGAVSRIFEPKMRNHESYGNCYEITLPKAINLDGEKVAKVAIGSLAGLAMAIQAAGTDDLQVGDYIVLTCTGTTDTGQRSPRVDFQIEIDRK